MESPATNNPARNSFLNRATALVDRSFSVIPIEPRGKRPIGPGATSRTRDLNVINAWANSWPDANAAVCSDENITLLESDDATRLRSILAGLGVTLPETLTGGASENRPHWFYKRTAACGSECVTVPGLFEWRNNNQYVVGPGSIHPSGAEYRFWNDAPIAELPADVIEALRTLAEEYQGEATGEHIQPGPYAALRDAYLRRLDPTDLLNLENFDVDEGERHYTLVSLAGLLHDGERSSDDIADILKEVRDTYFAGGKGDEEIESIARYAHRGEPCQFEPWDLPSFAHGLIVFASEEAMERWKSQRKVTLLMSPRQLRAREMDNGATEQLVDGLLPRHGVNTAVGDSNIGKSPLVVQLGVCVAAGLPFLGRETRQGKVVLLDFENTGMLYDMIAQTTKAVGADPEVVEKNLFIVDRDEPASLDVLIDVCKDAALIIVDSFRYLTNGREKDGSVVMPIMSKLGAEKNCWLLVHHIRKGEQQDESEKNEPLVKAESVVHWLERASGHRAIINQSTNRWAIDERGGIRSDLLIRVSVKGRGEPAPVHLNRIYEGEQPIGYEVAKGAHLLTEKQQTTFAAVMGKTLSWDQVVAAAGGGKSAASRFMAACRAYGLARSADGVHSFAKDVEGIVGW
jgi:hypothetical protein